MSGWILSVHCRLLSLGSASAPDLTSYGQPAYAQPAYTTPVSSAWDSYKLRLAELARQQGVRKSTIRANVPGLEDEPARD